MRKFLLIMSCLIVISFQTFSQSNILEKGLELYNDSNYKDAKPYFEKVVALNDEETGEAYFYLAEIAYFTLPESKKEKEHERLLRLSIDKDYVPAIIHLGGYIYDTGEGEKILLKGLEKFPNNTDIMYELANLYDTENSLDNAIDLYKRIANQGDGAGYLNLGYLYEKQQKYVLAEENYLKAIEMNTNESRIALANLYKFQKKYDLSEKYYLEEQNEINKSKRESKDCCNYETNEIYELVDLYVIQKRYVDIQKYYEELGTYDRKDILLEIAYRALMKDDYQTAKKYYLQAKEENPNSFTDGLNLAISLDKTGDYNLAEELYKSELIDNPSSAPYYVEFMFKQNRLDEVERIAEKYKNTDIEVEIYRALLSKYFVEKNIPEIKKYSQKLIIYDKSHTFELGYAYYLEKNYNEATKNFLIAKKYDSLEALYYLGIIEKDKGNIDKAKDYFTELYKKDNYYSLDLLNELKEIYEKEGNSRELKNINYKIDEIKSEIDED